MKVRSRGGSLIRTFIRELYKGNLAIRTSELIVRVWNESWSMVVYEKGIVKEAVI